MATAGNNPFLSISVPFGKYNNDTILYSWGEIRQTGYNDKGNVYQIDPLGKAIYVTKCKCIIFF